MIIGADAENESSFVEQEYSNKNSLRREKRSPEKQQAILTEIHKDLAEDLKDFEKQGEINEYDACFLKFNPDE